MPYSFNEYGYCWGNPLAWGDLDGKNPSDLEKINDDIYSYDRDAAIFYAEKWSNSMLGWNTGFEAILGKIGIGRNSEYYSYGTNCANFVSQCLYAGGIEKNSEWYSYRTRLE